ncbi:MAG TPA: hypothetical protein VI279_04975 [Rhodocyclaceae bacterium]
MIDAATLDRVTQAVATAPPKLSDFDLQTYLRGQFGGIKITVCSDDDLPPNMPPAAESAQCRLYYLDANEHCVKLSRDAESACGVVVGLRSGEED